MRRKLFLVISVMLIIAIAIGLCACGGNSSEGEGISKSGDNSVAGTNNSTDTNAEEINEGAIDPYGKVSEPITLHVGRTEDTNATYLEGQDSSNNYLVNYISEQLGIEYVYDFSVPGDSYDTKVAMVIASGEMPDVMTVNESQLRQLAQAGAVADMLDAYNKYASENLKAAYETTNGISFASATFDGKLMGMPNISPGADGIPMLMIRGDWMEELGLEAPETLDDIINIVNTFKEEKGASEGLVVSSNITSRTGNNTYGIDALFAYHGSYPKHFITNEEGELVYGSNTPETKKALGEIRKLVESGVIDSSFVVRDSTACEEIVASGRAGVFYGAWWNLNWPLNNMLEDDSSIYWNCYLAPLTDDGKYNTAMISPSNSYLVVRADASEAVKEAVIKTMNYQFDIDQEQGVSLKEDPSDPYSWTCMPFSLLLSRYDDKEAKALAAMEVVNGEKDASELTGEAKLWYESYIAAEENIETALAANNVAGWAYVRSAGLLGKSESIMNKVFDATYARTETFDSKWATLEKLEDETFLKILSGEASIDSFDEYVEQWNALGGNDIISELTELIESK